MLYVPDRTTPVVIDGFCLSDMRRWLTWWLAETPGAPREDTLLVFTELATNAYQHGGGLCQARVSGPGEVVRLEVDDADVAEPHLAPGFTGDGGLGLVVLERTCRRWGSVPHEGGKTVFAELPAAA